MIRCDTSAEACEFTLELSGAYEDENLQSFNRSWVWNKTELPNLALRDDFRFTEAPDSLTERFVSPIQPEMASPGLLRFVRGRLALELYYDPNQLEAEIKARTYRDHYGKDSIWYALDFRVKQPAAGFGVDFLFKFARQ